MVGPNTPAAVGLARLPRTSIELRVGNGQRLETTTCVRCGVREATEDLPLAWMSDGADLQMHTLTLRCCDPCKREESAERWRAPAAFSLAVGLLIGSAVLPPVLAVSGVVLGLGSLGAALWQLRRTRKRSLVAHQVSQGHVRVQGPGALGEVARTEAAERVVD